MTNAFAFATPSMYCFHPRHGSRWVHCAQPTECNITKAQKERWTLWEQHGVNIWVLTAPNEAAYVSLFREPNWRDMTGHTTDKPSGNVQKETLK